MLHQIGARIKNKAQNWIDDKYAEVTETREKYFKKF